MTKVFRKIWNVICSIASFGFNCVTFIWDGFSFSLKQIIIFTKHVAIVLGIVGAILGTLNGPGFAQSSRNDLNARLDQAFSSDWRNGEVLNIYFPVDKCILFNEEDIKKVVVKAVEEWNSKVNENKINYNSGFNGGNIPLHTVRAFYTDGEANKGPTIWLVSDNVTDIPEWLTRNEIR